MDTLYVITPFKDDKCIFLEKTINSLKNQNFIIINHILIIDKSSNNKIREFFKSLDCYKKNYKFILETSNTSGIYSAINQGLEMIKDNEPYIVIGAGDILVLNSDINFKKNYKIYYFPYYLSSQRKILINKFKNIFLGMPYCHNALIFRKNKLKYKQRYSLCGDYDYLLEYLQFYNIKIKSFIQKDNLIKEIKFSYLVYDDIYGLSSKKKNLVRIQTFRIIFEKYFILGIINYFFKLFKNLIKSIF